MVLVTLSVFSVAFQTHRPHNGCTDTTPRRRNPFCVAVDLLVPQTPALGVLLSLAAVAPRLQPEWIVIAVLLFYTPPDKREEWKLVWPRFSILLIIWIRSHPAPLLYHVLHANMSLYALQTLFLMISLISLAYPILRALCYVVYWIVSWVIWILMTLLTPVFRLLMLPLYPPIFIIAVLLQTLMNFGAFVCTEVCSLIWRSLMTILQPVIVLVEKLEFPKCTGDLIIKPRSTRSASAWPFRPQQEVDEVFPRASKSCPTLFCHDDSIANEVISYIDASSLTTPSSRNSSIDGSWSSAYDTEPVTTKTRKVSVIGGREQSQQSKVIDWLERDNGHWIISLYNEEMIPSQRNILDWLERDNGHWIKSLFVEDNNRHGQRKHDKCRHIWMETEKWCIHSLYVVNLFKPVAVKKVRFLNTVEVYLYSDDEFYNNIYDSSTDADLSRLRIPEDCSGAAAKTAWVFNVNIADDDDDDDDYHDIEFPWAPNDANHVDALKNIPLGKFIQKTWYLNIWKMEEVQWLTLGLLGFWYLHNRFYLSLKPQKLRRLTIDEFIMREDWLDADERDTPDIHIPPDGTEV